MKTTSRLSKARLCRAHVVASKGRNGGQGPVPCSLVLACALPPPPFSRASSTDPSRHPPTEILDYANWLGMDVDKERVSVDGGIRPSLHLHSGWLLSPAQTTPPTLLRPLLKTAIHSPPIARRMRASSNRICCGSPAKASRRRCRRSGSPARRPKGTSTTSTSQPGRASGTTPATAFTGTCISRRSQSCRVVDSSSSSRLARHRHSSSRRRRRSSSSRQLNNHNSSSSSRPASSLA